jgi:hypothetical protein
MKTRGTAAKKWLEKKSRRGFRGFPVATIACYGSTADLATKIVVAIVREEHAEPDPMERWFTEDVDVRIDPRRWCEGNRLLERTRRQIRRCSRSHYWLPPRGGH